MTPTLTRRCDRRCRHEETWHVYYGDVRVGTISERAGVPIEVAPWGWALGFYPGVEPPHFDGTAATFELAHAAFEECWQQILPTASRFRHLNRGPIFVYTPNRLAPSIRLFYSDSMT